MAKEATQFLVDFINTWKKLPTPPAYQDHCGCGDPDCDGEHEEGCGCGDHDCHEEHGDDCGCGEEHHHDHDHA
jgi:hypothetical protein